jgi:hypothetical protein
MKPLNVLEPLTHPFFYQDFKSALDRLEHDLVNGPCLSSIKIIDGKSRLFSQDR